MVEVEREASVTRLPSYPVISWGAIVAGVAQKLEQEGDQLMAEYGETVEQISDYVQWLLWLYFITAALSLGASALGRFVGSHRGEAAVHAAVSTRTDVR